MVGVNTFQAATVFAYFMLIVHLRNLVLVIMVIYPRLKRSFQSNKILNDRVFKKVQVDNPAADPASLALTVDARANRTIFNDGENDMAFLVLLVATAYFSDSVNPDRVKTIVYAAVYVSIRIVYAVVYIMGLQTWRTLLFLLGISCTLACDLDLIITMSRRSN